MVIATIGVCVPLFVISVLLLYLFAGVLKWLPTYGLTTWKHYILPVTCLSFSPIAYIARMTRSSMLEVMRRITSAPRAPRAWPSAWSFSSTACATRFCRL